MKAYLFITRWRAVMAFAAISLSPLLGFAQGTAFTYQGRLQNNGSPAGGTYNLTFSLFNTNAGGAPIAGPLTNNAVSVSNGLFTVLINFGPGVFAGHTNWLEIAVETNGDNTFTTLTPRQQLTPAPDAIFAESANGLSGTLSASQLTSIGNANGGFGNFFVGPAGNATTSGIENTANGNGALALDTSGSGDTANGYAALINNTSGNFNTAYGAQALIGNTSGFGNTANGYSTLYNSTSGSYNIALGFQAGVNLTTGSSNIDIGNSGVTGDTNIIRIGSGQSQTFIAGVITGNGNGLTSLDASQLTSLGNTNGGAQNFFVGPSGNSTTSGNNNTANGANSLFSNTSGAANTANGMNALYFNTSGSANTAIGVSALYSNLSGSFNTAEGVGALRSNTDGSNNIALGYRAGYNFTGSESSNIDIGNPGVTGDTNIIRIGSGQSQTFIAGVISGDGGGLINLDASQLTSIGNTNGGANFFVGFAGNPRTSGFYNMAIGWDTFANNTSGSYNTANGTWALVHNGSGNNNTANGDSALFNNTSGDNNTADGGGALFYNTSGSNNIALGCDAGYYISTGSSNIDIGNAGLAADNNIIRIGASQTATYLVGTVYANGVALTSDRNAKENFTGVNGRDVLARVVSLPVTEWNYKMDSKDVQHIGPMAQDFQAAFGLNGADDKHISVVDEGGVALAAIQGLNQKLQEELNRQDAENAKLKQQNDSLAERVNKLEGMVKKLAANK